MPYELSRRLGAGPLLCDGAMGTLLYARGVSLDACFDVLNLNNPRVVQSIHADYIAAGADCIETNTFGANRFKLAVHGLEGRVREVNRRGVVLARDVRESSGRDVFVLGSIGPLGKYLAPLGTSRAASTASSSRRFPTWRKLRSRWRQSARSPTSRSSPRWRSPTTASRSRAGRRPRSRVPCVVFRFRASGRTARSARAPSTRSWSRCTPRPGGCPCVSSPTPACRAGSASA